MARSERALTILRRRVPEGERILDLGCGYGAGTAKFARHYETYGIDPVPNQAGRAKAVAPTAHITIGSGERLPYPDGHFAAVLILDVLEHVENECATIAETARVLRPGGLLVVSVPNAGLLRWVDSCNIYMWLTGEDPWSRPATQRTGGAYHRHYTLSALTRLLGGRFVIDDVHYSALGLAELIHLFALLAGKRLLRSRALYLALAFGYIGAFILEDFVPWNEKGYNLIIAARRT